MKIVFFGTPDFANDFLASLYEDEDISVLAVVAQPDKPAGRKQIITSPPTVLFAKANNIPVFQPTNLKDDLFIESLNKINADVFVIVAYGKIIPQTILDIPKQGNINVHPSKLPKYRGPSPLQAAIVSGEKETAISIMLIDKEMDHGPILKQIDVKIDHSETPETLRKKVVKIGAPLLVETLKDYVAGKIKPKEQNHKEATFCKLLTREDGIINWTESAEIIDQKIRGFTPWPGTSTTWNDSTIKIHKAKLSTEKLKPGQVQIMENKLFIGTSTNALEILELQPEGKQKMSAESFVNGNRIIDKQNLIS